MTDQFDCLICGRPALANGEPSCDCVTHSLSRPVHPPDWDPDPADVARFPLEPTTTTRVRPPAPFAPVIPVAPRPASAAPAPAASAEPTVHQIPGPVGQRRTPPSHRKPRQRTRMAAAAGGAVAAVVGCTALAASFLGGQGRVNEVRGGPSLSVPDNNPPADDLPDGDRTGESDDGGRDEGRQGGDQATAGASPSPEPEGPGTEEPAGAGDEPELDPPVPTTPDPTTPPDEDEPTPDPTTPDPDPATPTEPTDPGTEEPPTEDPEDPDDPPTGEPTDPGEEEPPPVLQMGDSGPEVVKLQQRLLQLNWVYMGEAHGVYDQATKDAVERFQSAYGVQEDSPGVYGAATRKTLESHTTEP
ncbi:peptidoglycan-binding domain-containing protein [Streptomyces mayteni]